MGAWPRRTMGVSIGDRFGSFEIVGYLGAGGMGDVYRARDARLNRDVAVKILKPAVATSASSMARFAREAQLLAALNHPNIAQIFGLEHIGESPVLVMELVEGMTLAARLSGGALPSGEAVRIAGQIAGALAAAHEVGIVHRDLKPSNVNLRPDGVVKLLDFGLAKSVDPPVPEPAVANRSTVTASPVTQPGFVVGTVAYMPPEQARGETVDRRADLWALGCLLFEMLAGRRAFDGLTTPDLLAQVIEREPAWDRLPPSTPPALHKLLRRCLQKDPRRRLDSAAAAQLDIDDSLASTESRPLRLPRRQRWLVGVSLTAAAAALAVAALSLWAPARRESVVRVSRFAITPPPAQTPSVSGTERDLALAADGSHLVFASGPQSELIIRPLHQLQGRPLQGTTNARAPFFSPDGRWVGFFDEAGTLKKVQTAGGAPTAIGRGAGRSRGATWGDDDTIVFGTNEAGSGLLRVAAAGGEITALTKPDQGRGERGHQFPSFLPGSRALLFTIVTGASSGDIAVLELQSGKATTIIPRADRAVYVDSGHLVYVVGQALWAVAFDASSLTVSGEPRPVVEGVLLGNYAVARDGLLAYLPVRSGAARTLTWLDRHGAETPIDAPPRTYQYPRLSPDGRRIAVRITDGASDVWTLDVARAALARITTPGGANTYPVWTPDGKRLIYTSTLADGPNLYLTEANGSGTAVRLTTSVRQQNATTVSRDSRIAIFHEIAPSTGYDLMQLSLDGSNAIAAVLQTRFDERNADLSPDGRWLAYESNETGPLQIHVRPFPRVQDGRVTISVDGGRMPRWAASGDELFFVDGPRLMSVHIQTTPVLQPERPRQLFESDGLLLSGLSTATPGVGRNYDISADGQRFLVIKAPASGDDSAGQAIVVVNNWAEELKTIVPPRR